MSAAQCRRIRRAMAAGALSALLALPVTAMAQAVPAQAGSPVELAGVRYEPTTVVSGATLFLNGAGIRFKAVFKVYTAGLYLSGKVGTTEAALAQPGPKRLQMVMLRDIDANELGRLFTRGLQENAPREELAKSLPGTVKMGEVFAAKKRLVAGDSFAVDWVPGAGTVVRVNGKPMADPIPEPEFFRGMMLIWLGKSPADQQLKDSLLGKPPPKPGGHPEN